VLLLDDTFVVNLGCSEEIWRVTKDNCGESECGKAFVQKEVIWKYNILHEGKRYLQGKPSLEKSKGSHTSLLRSAKSKRSHEANICQKN